MYTHRAPFSGLGGGCSFPPACPLGMSEANVIFLTFATVTIAPHVEIF